MGFAYDTQGTITYLVYEIQPGDVVDTMGLGMLTNNKIQGLAATQFTQMDTSRYIKFNVSAKVPVSQFFSGAVNRKRLIGVFKGIVSALISAEDYMIDPNSILLDMDYIFTDVSTCETVLICMPIQQDRPPVNLGQFFKNIMFSTQFDQTENCDYVAKIINYLNSAPIFSTYDFDALMDQLAQGRSEQANPVMPQPTPVQKSEVAFVQESVQKAEQKPVQMPVQPAVSRSNQQPVFQQTVPQQSAFQQIPTMPQQPVQAQFPSAQQTPGQFQTPQQVTQAAAPGKKMSYLSLLMHYSKENAAVYKAQKETEKASKQSAAPAAPAQEKPKKEKKEKKEKPKKGGAPGFAVPGQQPSVPAGQPQGFAIPGQQASIPMGQPQGFAVPGQQPSVPVGQPQGAAGRQNAPAAAQFQATQTQQPVVQQPANQYQSQAMDFGDTTLLGGPSSGDTTILGAQQPQAEPKPRLIRERNNEIIPITKPVFRIGKERSYVDYFISDNPAISRSHANIITRGQEYFLMDTNSKNHSYVNGGMIQSSTEVRIDHGSRIRLADEDFEFKIY